MIKFTLRAERPVAFDSPDHILPCGTMDNNRNRLFNKKLYALLKGHPVAVLDLGCGGGGFVKDCIDDGHIAAGLEGSDCNKKAGRAEWATIPDSLFTCDIARHFSLKAVRGSGEESEARFDAITAWDVMEHFRTEDLSRVCDNVLVHLKEGGLWIMSVSPNPHEENGIKLHQTVQPHDWWTEFFRSRGFVNNPKLVKYFGHDWVRSPLLTSPHSFHFVLTRAGKAPPEPPAENPLTRDDLWNTALSFIATGLALSSTSHLNSALLLLDRVEAMASGYLDGLHYRRALALLALGDKNAARTAALAELAHNLYHVQAQNMVYSLSPREVVSMDVLRRYEFI